MKIVHFSDWHWNFRSLPDADLYVCTGDMYDNYPVHDKPRDRRRMDGSYGWRIDREREEAFQAADTALFVKEGGFRRFLNSPDAPIVCVRGNHDFIDLAPLFQGCGPVHELRDNELLEVNGFRITGHRGIPFIFGSWNDEVQRDVLLARVKAMPEADIFLTHYPPADILDYEIMARGRIESYGLEGMKEELFNKMGSVAVHCFGHIHGCGGLTKELGEGAIIGGEGPYTIFSNAACNFNEFEVGK